MDELRTMTVSDLDFLIDLQGELRTQPTLATADPRYWVIMDYEYLPAVPEDVATHVMEMTPEGDYERYTVKELISLAYAAGSRGAYEAGKGLDAVCDWYFGKRGTKYQPQVRMPVITRDTFFLTLAEAERHLEENRHHYDADAYTYCMCAWRSLQVERLWEILRGVDLGNLRILLSVSHDIAGTYAAMDDLFAEVEDGTALIDEDLLGTAVSQLFLAWSVGGDQATGENPSLRRCASRPSTLAKETK